ncbi:MAG: signal peptidase I [Cyanobacteria bacterium]|nr:signal peptidase I [Cyanobacteriota bacterium]MEB3269935.1 signal peptidase I [Leptolyngbya sp.]
MSPFALRRSQAWLAANCSLIFPGLGQLYRRQLVPGALMAAAAGTLVMFIGWSVLAPAGKTLWGLWALVALGMLYLISVVDAGLISRRAGQDSMAPAGKDPWYVVFLSQILPGLGHLYLQRLGWATGLLGLGIGTALLSQTYPWLLPLPIMVWGLGCWHGYWVTLAPPHRPSGFIYFIVVGLVVMRLAVGSVPAWISATVEQCIVPSESMLPTLQVGDRLFVHKTHLYRPNTADIVVFEAPEAAIAAGFLNADTLLVKRVIGLPGQQVWIRGGQVFINREPLVEPYLQDQSWYEWGPEIVPPDHYFVLGDNRNFSSDSHLWGFVPAADLLGKGYKIYWPPSRVQSLLQPYRS